MYYKTNDEEWGTPYICDSLLTSRETIKELSIGVSMAPNPMIEKTKISIKGQTLGLLNLEIFDIWGNIVIKEKLRTSKVLCRKDISKGVYLIQISNEKGVLQTRKLLVQ